MPAAALIVASFLVGSIPFGLVIGRLVAGTDVREHGSGNIGFTNVYRVVGAAPGFAVLALDLGKGALCVLAAKAFYPQPQVSALHGWVVVGCAFAVIAGHNWSVFLKFKGGKGVAAGAGALLGFVPGLFLVLLVVWGILTATTRYISLASVSVATLFPALVFFVHTGNTPYLVFAVVGASAVVFQHRGNIGRLLDGTERRLGDSATPEAEERERMGR